MPFYLYPKSWANPDEALAFEDDDETWADVLANPEVGNKEQAQALCMASFPSGSLGRRAVHALYCYGAIFDIDIWKDRAPFELQDFKDRLDGMRYILYSSPSSTAAFRRWRLVLPFSEPMPPSRYSAFYGLINREYLDGVANSSAKDPVRLGYVHVVSNQEGFDSYQWHIGKGDRWDWTKLYLAEEDLHEVALQGLNRQDRWIPREQALRLARRRFSNANIGMEEGSGRTNELWKISCKLWFDWAAEDDEFVREILLQVNDNFLVPESGDEIEECIRKGHHRTVGEGRSTQHVVYGHEREPASMVNSQSLLHFSKSLKQTTNQSQIFLSDCILRLSKQETLPGEKSRWLHLLYKAIGEIANAFLDDKPESIMEAIRGSVTAMRAAGADMPSEADLIAIAAKRMDTSRQKREDSANRKDTAEKTLLTELFGEERDYLYTAKEIDFFEKTCGLNKHRGWIIFKKGLYYIFFNGAYDGPYCREDAEVLAQRLLYPAKNIIKLTQKTVAKDGTVTETTVPFKTLLEQYGTVPKTIKCCLWEDRSYFDHKEKTLITAGPQRRDIQPEFVSEVDEWMRLFAGDQYDALAKWVAAVDELRHECAALYLYGPHSVGKSMFAAGMGKLWKGGHLELDTALDEFNEKLRTTPLVLIDEALPSGTTATAALRSFISAKSRETRGLYESSVTTEGSIRVVFAANNLHLLSQTKEDLESTDLKAIQRRVFTLRCQQEAADFLSMLPCGGKSFVFEDKLARHALYLREKLLSKIDFSKRFLLSTEENDGSRADAVSALSVSTSIRSEVCSFLVSTLVRAKKSKQVGKSFLLVQAGEVFVYSPGLHSDIILDKPNFKYPARQVGVAIAGVSDKTTKKQIQGASTNVRRIKLNDLRMWCRESRLYEWEDIEEAIRHLDIEKPVSVISSNPHVDSGISAAELSVVESAVDGLEGAAS